MCDTANNFHSIVTKICVCLANGPRTGDFQNLVDIEPIASVTQASQIFMEILIFTRQEPKLANVQFMCDECIILKMVRIKCMVCTKHTIVLSQSTPPVPHYGVQSRCIERPGALIQGINRKQPAMMTSPDVYDCYDVWKLRNRLTLGLNVAENTNYMKNVLKESCLELNSLQKSLSAHLSISPQSGDRGSKD